MVATANNNSAYNSGWPSHWAPKLTYQIQHPKGIGTDMGGQTH